MQCEECKKNPATIHLAQIHNGQKVETHLCEECAARKGLQILSNIDFSIPNLLGSILGNVYSDTSASAKSEQESVRCPACGASFADIRQTGKLGCATCYEIYQKELESTLRRVHGHVQHNGKIPARSGTKVLLRRKIEALKANLQDAVVHEHYEKAAEIRDSIKELEKQL